MWFQCLHAAANRGNVELIEELLSAGCNINAMDDVVNPDNVLLLAAILGDIAHVDCLVNMTICSPSFTAQKLTCKNALHPTNTTIP